MKEYIPQEYWEDLLTKDFSLSGVGFQGLGKNYNKWLYRARKRIMDCFLQKYPLNVKDLNILDIGCGTGFYVEFWRNQSVQHLTGIDLTQKSVTELSIKYKTYKFYREDIGERELRLHGKFDLLTAFDVLFHIVDEDRFENAICNIGRLATTGATILISDNFLKKARLGAFNQAHRTLEQYKKTLIKNGIEVLDIKPIFYLMNGPINIQDSLLFGIYRKLWKIVMYFIGKYEVLGEIMGGILYFVDGFLIKIFKRSITTELLICRKKGVPC